MLIGPSPHQPTAWRPAKWINNTTYLVWQNINIFGNFLRVYLVFGILLNLLWQTMIAIGQILIDVNGQKLKNNPAIWSHWTYFTSTAAPNPEAIHLRHLRSSLPARTSHDNSRRSVRLPGWITQTLLFFYNTHFHHRSCYGVANSYGLTSQPTEGHHYTIFQV